jgi:hypothetical protein
MAQGIVTLRQLLPGHPLPSITLLKLSLQSLPCH